MTPEKLAEFSDWVKGELKLLRDAGDLAHAELVNDAVRGLDDVSAGRVGDADALLAQIQARRGAGD